MNHHPSNCENTGLLVSIRSVAEAIIAQNASCVSIIDLKEPSNGSLGCVSFDTAKAITDRLADGALKSIALGEAVDWPVWPLVELEARNELLSTFDFVKVGLSGLASDSNWIRRWKECFGYLPGNIRRVAVAYADAEKANSPSVEAVIESANEVGCSVLLIDTFCKNNGRLTEVLSLEKLTSSVAAARERDMLVVLAGSLRKDDVAFVQKANPDLVAIRGAACIADRASTIDHDRIVEFSKLLQS